MGRARARTLADHLFASLCMRSAELVLATVVVALAAFVSTQVTSGRVAASHSASGTLTVLGAAGDLHATDALRDAASNGEGIDELPGKPTVVANASVRANTVLALTTGRSEGRLANRSQYVLNVPRDDAWPAEDMQRRLAAGEAGTYIGALLLARDSILTRWPDRRATPLRVWVGDGGVHDGWNATYPSLVRAAFEEWAASGIPVRFTFVRDSTGADVRVRFVQQFSQGISGRTIWSRDSTWWLVGGEIELALSHPAGGNVNPAQLRAIALHEIGHLLGLDHVDDPTHIMAPRVRVRSLSDSDVATVRLLYSVPAGSAR